MKATITAWVNKLAQVLFCSIYGVHFLVFDRKT